MELSEWLSHQQWELKKAGFKLAKMKRTRFLITCKYVRDTYFDAIRVLMWNREGKWGALLNDLNQQFAVFKAK